MSCQQMFQVSLLKWTSKFTTPEYEYDYGDNLITIINPHPEGEAEAYTTRMEYDVLNRITRRIPASTDLTQDEIAEFAWGETIHIYDEPHPSAAANARNTIGRLGYSSSPVVTNIFKYNAQGQATEHRQIMEVTNLGEVSGVELVNSASYHDNGQLRLNSLYDETGGKTLVEDLLHEYDSRGLPRRVSAQVEIARFIRNHAGLVSRRETAVAGERINATYLYDKLGRITFLGTEQSPSGIRQFNQWYSYYANSMVKEIKEKPVDKAFRTMRFTWDTRHQVKQANQIAGTPGYSATFDYDRAGRLLNTNVALASTNPDVLSKTRVHQRDVRYAYDAIDPQRVNRLIRNSDNSTYADYDYDRTGNIVKRVIGDDTWELRYDGENRLRKVTNMIDGTAETYYYDGPDRVLAVRQANDIVNKVRRWFAGGEIHYQNGIREKNWYYVKEGQTLARIENGTEIEFMFQTPQGHEALSMKADGTVNNSKVYGPFGEVLYAELAGDKSSEDYTREFNGKDYDAVSGLHYYGHRYYDPVAIIWNRADPMYRFLPDKGYTEPRLANLYVYTGNNPISLLDPDGLDLERVQSWLAKNSVASSKTIGRAMNNEKAIIGYDDLRDSAKKSQTGTSVSTVGGMNRDGSSKVYGPKIRYVHRLSTARKWFRFPPTPGMSRADFARFEIGFDKFFSSILQGIDRNIGSNAPLTQQAAENIAKIAVDLQSMNLQRLQIDKKAANELAACQGNPACTALIKSNYKDDVRENQKNQNEAWEEVDVWMNDRQCTNHGCDD